MKIKEAFENIWKVKSMGGRMREEDKAKYYDIFMDGYGCALIDIEEKNAEQPNSELDSPQTKSSNSERNNCIISSVEKRGEKDKNEDTRKGCGKVWGIAEEDVAFSCGQNDDGGELFICPECSVQSKSELKNTNDETTVKTTDETNGKGCGKRFLHGVGDFPCDGKLIVNGKRKYCPECQNQNEDELCANCGHYSYNHLTHDGKRSSRGVYCYANSTKKFRPRNKSEAVGIVDNLNDERVATLTKNDSQPNKSESKSLTGLAIGLKVGRAVLDGFKKEIGEEQYNKIMNNPIKGCKCGFIKEGVEEICPKCENAQDLKPELPYKTYTDPSTQNSSEKSKSELNKESNYAKK